MLRIFALFCIIQCSLALYSAKSNVVDVGADSFKQEVMKHDGVVIVEFYAPWCGHCKSLAPEYEKAADHLKGVVKVVAIDATKHESLAQKYQIKGFPTVKIFGADKKNPTDYQGERKTDAIVTEAMKVTNALVKSRKAGKSGSSKSSGSSKGKSGGKKGSTSDVIELTDVNFNALVLESEDHWMVEFFAPWCGHCKNLAPEWASAATQTKGQVKFGAVDATANPALAQKYGIQGYPTIKLFPAGKKTDKPKDVPGMRDAQSLVGFALESLETTGAPIKISQIVDQSSFTEACGSRKLCAMLFVPHILDTGAKGRNDYLAAFHEVGSNFRKMPLGFVWSEAGAQPQLEETLSINGNYPTIALVSMEKKVAAVPKVSWSVKNMKLFMQGVLSGR